MTILDVVIWLLLIGFAAKGFMKGLIRELCTLVGLVAGGWGAFRYYHAVAHFFDPLIRLPSPVALSLAFILIFLSIGLLFYLLGHLLTVVMKIMLLGGVNRVGGVLFGVLEGGFILCMTLHLLSTDPVPSSLRGYLNRSSTARQFIATGREIVAGWESSRSRPAPGTTSR